MIRFPTIFSGNLPRPINPGKVDTLSQRSALSGMFDVIIILHVSFSPQTPSVERSSSFVLSCCYSIHFHTSTRCIPIKTNLARFLHNFYKYSILIILNIVNKGFCHGISCRSTSIYSEKSRQLLRCRSALWKNRQPDHKACPCQ